VTSKLNFGALNSILDLRELFSTRKTAQKQEQKIVPLASKTTGLSLGLEDCRPWPWKCWPWTKPYLYIIQSKWSPGGLPVVVPVVLRCPAEFPDSAGDAPHRSTSPACRGLSFQTPPPAHTTNIWQVTLRIGQPVQHSPSFLNQFTCPFIHHSTAVTLIT